MALKLPKLALPWRKSARGNAGRIAVSLSPGGVGLASVDSDGRLQFCQFFPEISDIEAWLGHQVEERGWQKLPCSVVLHPIYYQLLQAERPPVEGDELQSAVRWKVKELLDYPLEEAAIEHFALPDDAYRGRQKMLYVAALRKSTLHSLIDPIEASGMAVDCVEVTELAMHHLISRLPVEGGGIALVQLHESGGFINLVADGYIYLSRRLDVGLDKYQIGGDNSRFFDALFLEIQRSLDFFESQLGKGIITRLFYSPCSQIYSGIGDFLSTQLGLEVSGLDLGRLADIDEDYADAIDGDQLCDCAAAIGAATGYFQPELVHAAS